MIRSISTVILAVLLLAAILPACKHQSDPRLTNSADSTLNALNRIIEDDTTNPAGFIARSGYYLNIQKLDAALDDLNHALHLDPKNVKAHISISAIYVLMGKPQQALEALNTAISLDNANVEAYLKKAQLFLVMKDYENCAVNVEKVLELDKNNADAYYLKGVTLDENAEKEKAIQAFRQAVMLNPGHYDALMQLGYAFSDSKPQIAIDYFSNAVKADTASMEALYNLGMLYQENNQPGKAMSTYTRMLGLEPGNKLALYNAGYVNLVYLSDYPKGIEFFTKAIIADTLYTDAYFNRGYCYELIGQYEPARKDYQKVLELRVNDTKAIQALNRLDKSGKKFR